MPFKIDEEQLWDFFGDCGKIVNIRIVRDKETHLGKGIGYL